MNQISLEWNWFSTVNYMVNVVLMSLNERYQLCWDVTVALVAVERRAKDGNDDLFRSVFD